MIAAWQQKRNYPPTGYFTSVQIKALLSEAATAVAKYEEDQRKLEEAKKADDLRRKAEDEAKVRTAVPPPTTAAPAPVATAPTPSVAVAPLSGQSRWVGHLKCEQLGNTAINVAVSNGQGSVVASGDNQSRVTVSFADNGFSGKVALIFDERPFGGTFSGTISGATIVHKVAVRTSMRSKWSQSLVADGDDCTLTLTNVR
jgi:hypothetical protein